MKASALKLLFVIALLAAALSAPAVDINVRDSGAKGDGVTVDTEAIQRAIDACSAQGGGIVKLPGGQYVSGTILLKDNVTLEMADDATLLGSTNITHYQLVDAFRDGTGSAMGYCFIGAVGATNVGIAGKGLIDGRGRELLAARPQGNRNRPFLMRFVRCTGVSVRDASLQGSAAWTVHFSQCRNVDAERLTINSRGLSNNDGIDIDSTQVVRIRDCNIDTGDDAVCLKATSLIPCRDVEITGCNLKSRWGGVKFGTESVANFEDVRISNCQIRDARGGIKMLSVDGARLQNVSVSDVTMENVTVPIFMRLGARLRTFREGDPKQPVGTISNIVIRNLRATANSSVGILISGIPGHSIQDVTLENVQIELPGGGAREDARVTLEEKESSYPEITMFGNRLPAYGILARHVNGFNGRAVKLGVKAPDARPAIVFQDARDVQLSDWSLPAGGNAESVVRFEDVQNAALNAFSVSGKPEVFLRVEGNASRGIELNAMPADAAGKNVELGEGVSSDAVVSR